jgi:hypothetical protein
MGTAPLDQLAAAVPVFMKGIAAGDYQLEVDKVPLSEAESAWNRDQQGRRMVLTPGR